MGITTQFDPRIIVELAPFIIIIVSEWFDGSLYSQWKDYLSNKRRERYPFIEDRNTSVFKCHFEEEINYFSDWQKTDREWLMTLLASFFVLIGRLPSVSHNQTIYAAFSALIIILIFAIWRFTIEKFKESSPDEYRRNYFDRSFGSLSVVIANIVLILLVIFVNILF